MFYPTTCVRLRYGYHGHCLADFLGSMLTFAIRFFRRRPRTFKFDSPGGFAYQNQHLHSLTNHSVGSRKFHCSVSASLPTVVTECWPCLPSPSPFGWDLGPDWPRDDWHCPGNLSLAAGGNLTLLIVTYTYICFSISSRIGYPHHSTDMECSPTDTFIICYPAPSVSVLYPIIIHAGTLDQWAVTHSLNEWLLPSQHPGCHWDPTSLD